MNVYTFNNVLKYSFSVFLMFLIAISGYAQDRGKIVTDRPDQTESAETVPKKYIQIESGIVYEKENSNLTNFAFNNTLIRYGILESVELRLGAEYLGINDEVNDTKINGLAPVTIGTKVQVIEYSKIFDQLGFITHLQFPKLSSPDFEAKNIAPVILVAASNDITENISTGYNLGVEWDGFTTTANGIYSVALGYSIKDNIGVFGEFYGNFPEGNNKADIRFDTGITYLVLDNIQFDLSGGIGLNEAAPDFFIGAGFSGRFPN